MKKLMRKSHLERIAEKDDQSTPFFANKFSVYTEKRKVENGRVVKYGSFEDHDPVASMAQYKVSDFYLENILAAGAVDMLKPVSVSPNTGLEVAQNVEGVISEINADYDYNDLGDLSNNNVEKIEDNE